MARYMWDALDRRLDCETYAVGPFFDDWIPWTYGKTLPRKYVKEPYLPLPRNTAQLNLPYQAVVNQMPKDLDLFLTIDAGWHFSNRPDAKVVALIETDPHVLKGNYEVPKAYSDFTFSMQTPYMDAGEHYLPYAYDPAIHYPEEREKVYDACLIGLHYPQRDALVNELRKRGYKVYYDIGPSYDDYRELYCSSKVALSWSTLLDLPSRVWEAFGMGLPLVANHVPDMNTFFVDGEHYLGFDTLQQAVEQAVYLIENPNEAKKIADAGHRKVNGNSWDKRIQQVLETCRLR